ncbi:MAG: hypothetical protein Kow0029_25240 [Candidatus Rifleibacteriota bacterium]
MRINRWLWVLWGAMIVSMLLKRQADIYMVVALIILPILIVLLDLHEEIAVLKEENKHQRKFVMDRYNILQEKLKDVSSQIEKRLVVDFAEFAKDNPAETADSQVAARINNNISKPPRRKKRRKKAATPDVQPPVEFADISSKRVSNIPDSSSDDEDFEDI